MNKLYCKKVLRYFKDPKYAREMKDADAEATVGNAVCGDVLKFFIKVKNNKIVKISYLTYGCTAAISASEAVARMAKGKTLEQAMKITDQAVIKHLGTLPKIKFHCSVLGVSALKKAIESYKKTKAK